VHRFAKLVAASTFLLLIAGGLVTSTDSGLSVPDWPLSYGTWMPPMVGGIAFEHTHRMIAGGVGLLIVTLAIWLRLREPRRWVRWLGYAAATAVVAQAVLGGLTVLLRLPPPVSIAHACLGQAVFCLVVSIALVTSPMWATVSTLPVAQTRAVAWASLATTIALFVQLMLGAVLRHTGAALMPHVVGAIVVVTMTVRLVWWSRQDAAMARVRSMAITLLIGVGLQVCLGALSLAFRNQALITTSHLAVGALLLAQSCCITWLACRLTGRVSPARQVPVGFAS